MMDAPSFPPGSTLILQQGFAGPDEGLLLAEVDDLDL
jgi:hypothetical protein